MSPASMSEPGPKFAAGLPLDSELLYRSLFESSVAFVCIHQLDGTLLAVNPAAAQCLGYPAEQAVGHTIAEFMPPESAAGFAEYLAAIQKHGRHSGEMHLRTRSGDVRVWSYSNVVVRPDRGEPYVIGHAVDITERRRAEVDRERLIAELQEALGRVAADLLVLQEDPRRSRPVEPRRGLHPRPLGRELQPRHLPGLRPPPLPRPLQEVN